MKLSQPKSFTSTSISRTEYLRVCKVFTVKAGKYDSKIIHTNRETGARESKPTEDCYLLKQSQLFQPFSNVFTCLLPEVAEAC